MAKQFTVNLSERQRFYVWTFVLAAVQPKNRDESRKLRGVFETFGLDEIQERAEGLAEGEHWGEKQCDSTPKPIETGSVDLNTLLGYLDQPGAGAMLALRLLDVSDELLRVKEGRSQLAAVPDAPAESA